MVDVKRPAGAIRIGDRVPVETGGVKVPCVIRSCQTRGRPVKLTGSFGFSVVKEDDEGEWSHSSDAIEESASISKQAVEAGP